jgi:PhnB protein
MFNGQAIQAIELYKSALGAEVEHIQRFGEMAGPGSDMPDSLKQRVMHGRLKLGPGAVLISDTDPSRGEVAGNNVRVCLELDDADDLRRKFDALAVGGNVTLPVQDMFWGATFGMLVDAFGVPWMFNHTKPQR